MAEHPEPLYPPPSFPAAHLDDRDLINADLSADAEKHIADCARCRQRSIDAVAIDDDFGALLNSLEVVDTPTSYPSYLPTTLRSLIDHSRLEALDPPAVETGQLWRVSWRGRSALIVVLSRHGWRVEVAPVTTDVNLADELTVLLEAGATSLGVPTAVFLRPRTTVPLYVFDTFLGSTHVADGGLANTFQALIHAQRTRTAPRDNSKTGPPLELTDFDKHAFRDALTEELTWYESAFSDVSQDGQPLDEAFTLESEDEPVALTEVLNRANTDFASLAAQTGIGLKVLLALTRGTTHPTTAQAATLSKHLGTTLQVGPPPTALTSLLEIVSSPKFRPSRRQWNADRGVTEADSVRPLVDRVLHEPIAARSTSRDLENPQDRNAAQWRTHWESVLTMLLAREP